MKYLACGVASLLIALLSAAPVQAVSMRAGLAAYNHENFNADAANFLPLALAGDMRAQSILGYMYQTGRGVPQSYVDAVYWYQRAAEQGDGRAQYLLGLLYDKGQGVKQNYIEAHKWLNIATAHAPPENREYSKRLRDAVATKMTRGQITTARWLAVRWVPLPERLGAPHP